MAEEIDHGPAAAGENGAAGQESSQADTDAPSADDSDLYALLRNAVHDRQAFRQFYARTAPRLLAVCRRVTGSADLAEEVMQEVYVLVWRYADRYDPSRGPIWPWLTTIAKHRAISALRNRFPPTGNLDEDSLIADSALPADQVLAARQERERVEAAVDLLPPGPRSAMRLALFEGLTYPEVAANLAVPLNTVKSWIRRSLLTIKTAMRP